MATQVVKTTYQFKRGYSEAWERLNPILAEGEPGWAIDTKMLKIGDGITPWKDLPSIGDEGYNPNSGIINAPTRADFPPIGNVNNIYKAQNERQLYQWNSEAAQYELLIGSNLEEEILILYGGSASDLLEV